MIFMKTTSLRNGGSKPNSERNMVKNNIAGTLRIRYPIIQSPMLGVSTPEMAAVVSNEGGLGSLPVGGLSPDATRQLIRKTKSLTDRPFAVNLFAHTVPGYDDGELEQMRSVLLTLARKRGYPLQEKDLTGFTFHTYHDQVDILIEESISITSFTFGCLDEAIVKRLRQNGSTLIGTATCVEEAVILQQQGIDMISVQGIEAGGHRGTFIDTLPPPQVGLFALLPQVKQAVQLPLIAAGAINDAQTIQAALNLGADAVQVGTAFIGADESIAIPAYKQKLAGAKENDTVLTRAFSGRWARGIQNEMMKEIETAGIPIPPYPYQNSLTTPLRKLAQQNDDGDYTNLWAGQSAPKTMCRTTKDVFRELVRAYESIK